MTPFLYKYSDTELKELLKTLTVIVDSREKENSHITAYFDAKKIPYIIQGLDFGDYCYMLPATPELGIVRDMYFTNEFVIERKASLEELSGNLAQERQRFENEFLRARACKIHLLIERGCYGDIYNHKYRTQLSEKAYISSLIALQHKYNINVSFIDLGNAGAYIHQQCYYHLREFLKG